MSAEKVPVLRAKGAVVQCRHEFVFLRERQCERQATETLLKDGSYRKEVQPGGVHDVFFCKFCLTYKEIPRTSEIKYRTGHEPR